MAVLTDGRNDFLENPMPDGYGYPADIQRDEPGRRAGPFLDFGRGCRRGPG